MNKCTGCKKPPDKETFPCDYCKDLYCQDCSNLSSTEIRVMQLKSSRVLNFVCNKCKSPIKHELIISRIEDMENILLEKMQHLYKEIQFQDEKSNNQAVLINRLVNEISDMKEIKQKDTYAKVTANKNSEVLVVKPKEKQQSIKTKIDLKNTINPSNMAIAVENIKEGKEGAVIINCNNANSKEKLREAVEHELGNKYKVVDGKQKNPKIIIRGVEEEFIDGTNETIMQSLKEQNDLVMVDDSVLEVYSKYKQKDKINKGNIILTVDVHLKKQICKLGKLNIGWRRCIVHEFFSIIRCFKCARYGHVIAKCENNTTCYNCAGAHKTEDCNTNLLKCINCQETNTKLKKSLQTNHSVTDPSCPCYQRILSLEERKTKQA